MASIQMNVRIDKDKKAEGDRAFSSIDFTPTEVVRAMWDFAARNRNDRVALLKMMQALQDPHDVARAESEVATRDAEFESWLSRGPGIVRTYAHDAGISTEPIPTLSPEDYDELLGEALDEACRPILERK